MKHPSLFVVRWLIAVVCLLSPACLIATQQAEPSLSLGEAFGVIAGEQSLGESYASLLKTVGKEDFQRYADGIRLYANAKAAFDALIEQMHQEIRDGKRPDESDEFRIKLDAAVTRRVAFTKHVEEIVASIAPGTPRAIGDALTAPADLIKAITDSAMPIWKEYRRIKEEDRKNTLSRLDALKWKSFHEIAG